MRETKGHDILELRRDSCLSNWLPTLAATGVPVPRTALLRADQSGLLAALDGETAVIKDLAHEIRGIVQESFSYPFFLRTGQTSGKFEWSDTCFITKAEEIHRHVRHLVEFSSIVDMIGLSCDVWAVREYIPMRSLFTCFRGMPVAVESRFFIAHDQVICSHPYWPSEAFDRDNVKPSAEGWRDLLAQMQEIATAAHFDLAEKSILISKHFKEAWSLDWALSESGVWYAIDMARAEVSWHRPNCPKSSRIGKAKI